MTFQRLISQMQSNKRVLIVGSEAQSGAMLGRHLDQHTYDTVIVTGVDDALDQINRQVPQLIIVVDTPPALCARAFCRKLRAFDVRSPIIVLSQLVSDGDVVSGLNAGANDYLVEPVAFDVLLARMRVQLRSMEPSAQPVLKIGHLYFKPSAQIVMDGEGRRTKLTNKEAKILLYLFRAEEQLVNKQTLLSEIWDYRPDLTTHTLETHVYRLRQKIEKDPSDAKLLLRGPGGYRLASGSTVFSTAN